MKSMEFTQKLLCRMGEVVHQGQRERGCASLYLDSLGKIFSSQFADQIPKTDGAIHELKRFLEENSQHSLLNSGLKNRLKLHLDRFDTLSELRDEIHLLKMRYAQAINQYTFSYILPTIDMMIELAQQEQEYTSDLVTAFSNFLQWKERIGMERALGARGFYVFSFRNPDFYDRFVSLVTEQKSYLETFKSLASPQQISVVEAAIDKDDLSALQNINSLLEDNVPAEKIEKYDAESWFALLTRMIDSLREAELKMLEHLVDKEVLQPVEAVASPPNKDAKGKLKHYRQFLESLPTFAMLESKELDEILSFSQIREYKKDKLLFLRDEPATRLYIILEGWVKAYNGLVSGEEAILQMLGKGETLLESAVFLNAPSPISAQVVEQATLLSIPAPVIRQRLQSSPKLALSMLNTVSLRSQRLVHQIELSRLKTVRERVGWFLLRLALNQEGQDGIIHLPYEKSVIASYLDMRPETLSRVLQKFRQDGFEIASDHVKPRDRWALCDFCEVEMAGQCTHAKSEDCPRPELYDIPTLEQI